MTVTEVDGATATATSARTLTNEDVWHFRKRETNAVVVPRTRDFLAGTPTLVLFLRRVNERTRTKAEAELASNRRPPSDREKERVKNRRLRARSARPDSRERELQGARFGDFGKRLLLARP